MNRPLLIQFAILALGNLASAEDATTESAIVQNAIDGILARADAIYTAEIEFTYADAAIEDSASRLRLSIEGADWRLDYPQHDNFRMNRNATGFAYTLNHYEGKRQTSLYIEAGESLDDLIGKNLCHLGPRMGTLWFSAQREFVESNRDDAIRLKNQFIGGRECIVLQWRVKPTNYRQAFIRIPIQIAKRRGGLLRIYAARDLDWALPLFEYCTPDGKPVAKFEASDFRKYAEGVHFPNHLSTSIQTANAVNTSTFKVHDIRFVNDTLPKERFQMKIPHGTRVRDSRPGMAQAAFTLKSQDQLKGLNLALGKGTAIANKRRRLGVIALNAAIGIMLAFYFYSRRRTFIVAPAN